MQTSSLYTLVNPCYFFLAPWSDKLEKKYHPRTLTEALYHELQSFHGILVEVRWNNNRDLDRARDEGGWRNLFVKILPSPFVISSVSLSLRGTIREAEEELLSGERAVVVLASSVQPAVNYPVHRVLGGGQFSSAGPPWLIKNARVKGAIAIYRDSRCSSSFFNDAYTHPLVFWLHLLVIVFTCGLGWCYNLVEGINFSVPLKHRSQE